MPKRRNSSDEGVSLFPFMSILACLIGILTLMISVTMQLKQLDNQGRTEEEKSRAIENRDLKKEAEKLEKDLAEAQKKLEREKATVSQLAKLEERRIVLEQQFEETAQSDPDQTSEELQKLVELLKKETISLQLERPPLSTRLEELRAELAARKTPPKSAESVVIRPGGTGLSASASLFFVECNSTGIVIRSGPGAPVTVSTSAINDSETYGQFLENVKRTRDSMVLFLVRRSGNDAYLWAAGIADSRFEVSNGKLPIPNDGEIDLSLFEK